MLYIGTKIVVIGSNIKRKAGPRTGSIGYVAHITHTPEVDKRNGIMLFSAVVLFSHFGFQKQTRHELQNVRIVLPKMDKLEVDMQKVYANVTRFLKQTEDNKRRQYILVCPYNNQEEYDLHYKIHSLIYNTEIREKLHRIANNINAQHFPHTDTLRKSLSVKAVQFLESVVVHQDFNCLVNKIMTTDITILKEILSLIIKLNSLKDITAKKEQHKIIGDLSVHVARSFFKPYEFLQTAKKLEIYVGKVFLQQCMDMSVQFSIEGSKVINKRA